MDKEEAIRCQETSAYFTKIAMEGICTDKYKVKAQIMARNYAGMARFHMGLELL